jgi:hypothetical protein
MDVIAAFESVGTYRGAAEVCGTTHKTVKRIVEAHQAAEPVERKERGHNYDDVAELVGKRVKNTEGKISAKRLLPAARAAGYGGSPRNFRRLVAEAKRAWRLDHHRTRPDAIGVSVSLGTVGGRQAFPSLRRAGRPRGRDSRNPVLRCTDRCVAGDRRIRPAATTCRGGLG